MCCNFKNICLFLLLCQYHAFSQDQSFENTTVPTNWTATNDQLSISDLHYKDQKKSLQWDFNANDVLTIHDIQSNGLLVNEVLNYYKNMFNLWIYNSKNIVSKPLTIEFYDAQGQKQFHYVFYLDFTGWRSASASYKHEMSGAKSSDNLSTIKIIAPDQSGQLFFDGVDYTADRNTYRSPDYQLPFLKADNGQHWTDMMYFKSLEKTVPLSTPSQEEIADLAKVKEKYDAYILGSQPSSSALSKAKTKYTALDIQYTDGNSTGKPLYGKDYPDSQNIYRVEQFIYTLAKHAAHTQNNESITLFTNTVRYLLDQGYADGSLMESMHHIGYTFRNIPKAIHLMKDQLQEEQLWEAAQKMVGWYAAVDIIWHPTAHESNMDDGNTRALAILGACLYKSSPEERVQYLKGYKKYLENWMQQYPKTGTGLKPDYTAFHHNTYYPLYAFAAYKNISKSILLLSGGSYSINQESKKTFKQHLLMARVLMANEHFPNALSGRSPFHGISINESLKNLGLSMDEDAQLLGAYNYNVPNDPSTQSIPIETAPTGFWQVNFANLGIYRQGDWMASIKGFNNDFWGTEIYGKDNRYGRYQSYGAIEILYKGGHGDSGFSTQGWDWNKTPGATTIHLPWNALKAAKSRQDETTDARFAGSLRFAPKNDSYIDEKLEGNYGLFGMDFSQKNLSDSHNPSFKFKKSVFCFDGKLICLGSNIANNDTQHITATNLFQNVLQNEQTELVINSQSTRAFPLEQTLENDAPHWMIDGYNTGYYIPKGSPIIITKKNQDSPSENGNGTYTNAAVASAYINHGTAPNNASYEFVLLPNTTNNEISALATAMQNEDSPLYKVLQQDENAHIVSFQKLIGHVLFKASSYQTGSPVLKNSAPCLLMTSAIDEQLRLSIADPYLNFDTTTKQSTPTTIVLELNGAWELEGVNHPATSLTVGPTSTTLTTVLSNGLPVDIHLKKQETDEEKEPDTPNPPASGTYKLYPNPSADYLHLAIPENSASIASIKLFNSTGSLVFETTNNKPIDVRYFTKGIYIARLETVLGKKMSQKVLIY